MVERELANYKAEVELKYKASVMNAEYVFQRKKSTAVLSGSGAPQRITSDTKPPDFYVTDFTQATKIVVEDISG
jgi:hypothetical protein